MSSAETGPDVLSGMRYALPSVETFGTSDVRFLTDKLVEESAELMVAVKRMLDAGGEMDGSVRHEIGDVECTLANLLLSMGVSERDASDAARMCGDRFHGADGSKRKGLV